MRKLNSDINNDVIRLYFGKTPDYNYGPLVSFHVDKLNGCCGVAVIFHVCWNISDLRISGRPDLLLEFYRAVHEWLVKTTEPFNIDRAKLLMTDGCKEDGSPLSVPSIADFCQTMGWLEGTPSYNKKSGNYVNTYEFLRASSRSF